MLFRSERQRSHDTLAEREKASEAQLAEAKLRHAVGEFGEEKWNELHSEIMSGLVEVREVLQSTDAEIQRLEEVLALIRQKPPSTEVRRAIPMPEPPPPPAPAPTAVAPAPSPPPPGADRMAEAPTAQSKAFDELAFLKSVTDDEDLGPAPSRASGRSVTHGADAKIGRAHV